MQVLLCIIGGELFQFHKLGIAQFFFVCCRPQASLFLLQRSSTTEQVSTVLEVLRRHRHIWASMNVTKSIIRALFVAYQVYAAKGSHCQSLIDLLLQLDLLLDVDNDCKLEETERQRLMEDITNCSHVRTRDVVQFGGNNSSQALYPFNKAPDPVPPVLPDILLLTQDASAEAPSILVNRLWNKYRTAPDWAWNV
jgi:mediator of RNA polymerase II transcription subunit 12, fungi type